MASSPPSSADSVQDKEKATTKRSFNCLQRAGNFLAGGLERFYFSLGVAIAKRPIITICCVLIACLACTAGLVNFYEVDASDPIWVDPKSLYVKHKQWVDERFPSQLRFSFFIAESDNILRREALLELYDLHFKLTNISGEDYTYEELCTRFGRGSTAECWSTSILELWEFNRTAISLLNTTAILHKVNTTVESPVTNADFDVTSYLGGITRDSSGRIFSAKAAIFTYFMQGTNSTDEEYKGEDEVTALTEKWELKFVETIRDYSGSIIKQVFGFATRSFGDEIGDSIFGDITFLSAGYFLIIIYVALILGRFNWIEVRVYLAIGAVVAVGLSIAVSFGLSSAFGIGYGPVQSILPFLLLGLGVDDAFVIVQAWNCLTPAERSLPLIEQSGHALKHAGVSITVTSITDIVAFGIGASTVLPALRDFCIYATIGILAVFIIQATFFSACVVLDEKRRTARRNGCCCCYTHKDDYQPNDCSKRDLQQKFFEEYYGPTLVRLPARIGVIIVSLGLLALGIYGVINLEQEFDPNIFIPSDSYLKKYFNTYEEYFPDLGTSSGHVYIDGINYYKEHGRIKEMIGKMASDTSVDSDTVDSWLDGYEKWLNATKCPWIESHLNSTTRRPLDERRFNMLLTPYIYMSADGRRHISDVNFNGTLESNDNGAMPADVNLTSFINNNNNANNTNLTTPDILELEADYSARYLQATRIPFDFANLPGSVEKVKAMDDTRAIVNQYYTDVNAFPFSRDFENWETDKVIQKELYKNMGLAFGCVVVLTLLLIADVGTCALVSICVLSTLVEVGGFMYFWGLKVDTVTCIQLILAIGLAVDYSAHIGHTFMTVNGCRTKRTIKTMANIGPAVFNGGFSTLLAFLLLANSTSYVFDVFFRVNLLVVVLGLWNGMVLLPTLLSLIGPPPYLSVQLDIHQLGSNHKISDSSVDKLSLESNNQEKATDEEKKAEPIDTNNSNIATIHIVDDSATDTKM